MSSDKNMKKIYGEVGIQRENAITVRQVLRKREGDMLERKDPELERLDFKFQLCYFCNKGQIAQAGHQSLQL